MLSPDISHHEQAIMRDQHSQFAHVRTFSLSNDERVRLVIGVRVGITGEPLRRRRDSYAPGIAAC
jgi:hypothetical protein